jgi:hypothetical protein
MMLTGGARRKHHHACRRHSADAPPIINFRIPVMVWRARYTNISIAVHDALASFVLLRAHGHRLSAWAYDLGTHHITVDVHVQPICSELAAPQRHHASSIAGLLLCLMRSPHLYWCACAPTSSPKSVGSVGDLTYLCLVRLRAPYCLVRLRGPYCLCASYCRPWLRSESAPPRRHAQQRLPST